MTNDNPFPISHAESYFHSTIQHCFISFFKIIITQNITTWRLCDKYATQLIKRASPIHGTQKLHFNPSRSNPENKQDTMLVIAVPADL